MRRATRPEGLVYVRGRLVDAASARVSAFDHGFLYGDSVYETLRTEDGEPMFLRAHLDRLSRSAALVGLPLPRDVARVPSIVETAHRRLRAREVAIRIMVTRGPGAPRPDPTLAGPSQLLIYVRPFVPRPAAHYRDGVSAIVAKARRAGARSIPPAAKTGNFLPNVLAIAEARAAKADEVIMLSLDGHLAEGATSNLFWWKGAALLTPDPRTGCLPGITRRAVLDIARAAGARVREVRARPRRLYAADEAFLTQSTGGVIPLVRVDGHRIGAGRPGPRTRDIAVRYAALCAGQPCLRPRAT